MINLIKKKGINPNTRQVLYFPQWTRVQTTDKKAMARRMARQATFSVGEVEGLLTDISQFIADELLSGNAAKVDGLGTFKLKVSGNSKPEAKDLTTKGCKAVILFEPDDDISQRLLTEAQYQFVQRPTAEGVQDADTGEDAGGDATGDGTQGDTDNPSGGSHKPSEDVPPVEL